MAVSAKTERDRARRAPALVSRRIHPPGQRPNSPVSFTSSIFDFFPEITRRPSQNEKVEKQESTGLRRGRGNSTEKLSLSFLFLGICWAFVHYVTFYLQIVDCQVLLCPPSPSLSRLPRPRPHVSQCVQFTDSSLIVGKTVRLSCSYKAFNPPTTESPRQQHMVFTTFITSETRWGGGWGEGNGS